MSSNVIPELRERAVGMLREHRSECPSELEGIRAIAPKIGCHGDTLRAWLHQHERDSGGLAPMVALPLMSVNFSKRCSARTWNCVVVTTFIHHSDTPDGTGQPGRVGIQQRNGQYGNAVVVKLYLSSLTLKQMNKTSSAVTSHASVLTGSANSVPS
jgi:hypothetical protein